MGKVVIFSKFSKNSKIYYEFSKKGVGITFKYQKFIDLTKSQFISQSTGLTQKSRHVYVFARFVFSRCVMCAISGFG